MYEAQAQPVRPPLSAYVQAAMEQAVYDKVARLRVEFDQAVAAGRCDSASIRDLRIDVAPYMYYPEHP